MSLQTSPNLKKYLEPFEEHLNDDIEEIMVNKPHEFFVEKKGVITRYESEELTLSHLHHLTGLIAKANNQVCDETKPILSGTLPSGERVQVVRTPATKPNHFVMAIRKPSSLKLTLDDYIKAGSFDKVKTDLGGRSKNDEELLELYQDKDNPASVAEFLKKSILYKKNIIVSGATSSGKTTLTNMLLELVPLTERLLTIEDSNEINIPHPNQVNLIYAKSGQGLSNVTPLDLVEASLRLRPDRILMAELRGKEAYNYLEAINTGHDGSITSLHASSTDMAFERLALMVMQNNLPMDKNEIIQYLKTTIDVIVQFKAIVVNGKKKRVMTELYYEPR